MNLEKISIKIAFLLRHSTDPLYIDLNGGWALADDIINKIRKEHPGFDRACLEEIVSKDNKGRYSFDKSGAYIRANQGHSIPDVKIEMVKLEPPELLYHGTAARFLPLIANEGLKPMTRQFVHISSDYETALKVGKRHGTPVVLLIRARDMVADGYDFFISDNGVWQTKFVPPEYLTTEYPLSE